MIKNVARLEAYYWIARLGSFHAAGNRLGLTQPSISIRVRELETELGGALFTRSGRGVRLTEKGRTMFEDVERILAMLSDLDGRMRQTGSLQGIVRLGVPDSFALCCLPAFVEEVDRSHPDVRVTVTVDNSRVLAQRMEDGLLDLAILAQPEQTSALRFESLGRQSLAWVAGSAIDLPSRTLQPSDLVRRLIMTNPSPSPSYSILMDWFREHGLVPARVHTCSSISAILGVTLTGASISVVPACVVKSHLAARSLVALSVDPALPHQDIFAAYPKGVADRSMPALIAIARAAMKGTDFVSHA